MVPLPWRLPGFTQLISHLDRVEVGVGVAALRLVGGAPVIVPDGQVLHAPRLLVQGLGLVPGMSLLLRTIDLQFM